MGESLKKEIIMEDRNRRIRRFKTYADAILKLTEENRNKEKKGAGK